LTNHEQISLGGRPALIRQVRRGKPGYRGHPTANKQMTTFCRNFKKLSETLSGFLEINLLFFSSAVPLVALLPALTSNQIEDKELEK
jgi:hypothetical protein